MMTTLGSMASSRNSTQSRTPIFRLASLVHDGVNGELLCLRQIIDAEWEPPQTINVHAFSDRLVTPRISTNRVDGGFDFEDESFCGLKTTLPIPFRSFLILV